MKAVVRLSMSLVALAAFALSFQSLMTLGQFAGYGSLAWLYPVVVDLGTVSSCITWLATRARQAFRMTWALLSISVVQNGTVHWLIATGQRPEWWLVTAVATVPPMVLGLTVHLAVGMRSPDQREGLNTLGGAAPPPDVSLGKTHVSGETDGAHVALCEDLVTKLLAQGAGRRRVASELGISEHQAKKLVAARKNGDGQ